MSSKLVSPMSPALAVWNQRRTVAESRHRLERLYNTVGRPGDLKLHELVQWFAIAMEFRPDLIIELGRLQGNSTCAFTEAANRLANCRVISVCITDRWEKKTRARVAEVVEDDWFAPLDALVANILTLDMSALVGDSQRPLVLWDAHGFDVANCILGSLLPALFQTNHVVLMHDIGDIRYSAGALDYEGKPIWRGGNDGRTRLVFNHLTSPMEQFVAITDFASRNGVTLGSAEESFHKELTASQIEELEGMLGDAFSQRANWCWFSLNELPEPGKIHFPAFRRPGAFQSIVSNMKHSLIGERVHTRLARLWRA